MTSDLLSYLMSLQKVYAIWKGLNHPWTPISHGAEPLASVADNVHMMHPFLTPEISLVILALIPVASRCRQPLIFTRQAKAAIHLATSALVLRYWTPMDNPVAIGAITRDRGVLFCPTVAWPGLTMTQVGQAATLHNSSLCTR